MFTLDSRIVIAASAAATLLAAGYILWGPSRNKKVTRKALCPGLVNLGNTCFLNAILQSLAPCSSVAQWLDCFVQKHNRDYSRYLATTLLKVLQVLNNNSIEYTEEFCPIEVIERLKERRWVIQAEEQDAHELFHVLTGTLAEEAVTLPSNLSLFDADSLQSCPTEMLSCGQTRIGTPLLSLPARDSDHPFHGLLASQLQCKKCAYKCPVKYDTFDSLSLSIPNNHWGPLTLDGLLRRFVMSETVQNVVCESCMKSTDGATVEAAAPPRTTFLKKLTLGRIPPCLCIHIQRTVWLDSGLPMKRMEHVQFPEVLDLNEYMYRKQRDKTDNSILSNINPALLGGRALLSLASINSGNRYSSCAPNVSVSLPYSPSLNLLKARNYQARLAMTECSNQCSNQSCTSNFDSFDKSEETRSPNVSCAGEETVKELARAYGDELARGVPGNAYVLNSVVSHLGDVTSGHFVCYRRAPSVNGERFPNGWLYTSDAVVQKTTLTQVLESDAYMLFYERI